MKRKITTFVLVIVFVIALIALSKVGDSKRAEPTEIPSNKISVVTSFYPLYFFASQIGGDKVEIVNITPAGVEPHDYELSTQDITRMEKAKIVILNGGGLETWGDKVRVNLSNKETQIMVAADGLLTQEVEMDGETRQDPHIWLDPVLAKKVATKIMEAFVRIDPKSAADFQANNQVLEKKLDMMDSTFREGLKDCQKHTIITSHAAFGYLATRYGLKQVPITGLSPEQEPSPQELSAVAQFARENGVKYIFFETLLSPKLSETIAREVGAKTIVFNPLEGLTRDDSQAGKDYFSIQRENLDNLRIALECK